MFKSSTSQGNGRDHIEERCCNLIFIGMLGRVVGQWHRLDASWGNNLTLRGWVPEGKSPAAFITVQQNVGKDLVSSSNAKMSNEHVWIKV